MCVYINVHIYIRERKIAKTDRKRQIETERETNTMRWDMETENNMEKKRIKQTILYGPQNVGPVWTLLKYGRILLFIHVSFSYAFSYLYENQRKIPKNDINDHSISIITFNCMYIPFTESRTHVQVKHQKMPISPILKETKAYCCKCM